jgi:glycosyltransferase involved in cell wall biosynthesis
MSKLSDVTIVVPIYVTTPEALDWLKECLASAFAQKCNVVVYDDGSTIDIAPVLGIYLHDYEFSQVENHGVSYARNRAIEAATTDLILPLDCDDRLKDGAVEEMVAYWNLHGVPVYPDIAKFGTETVPHYVLLDFACAHITEHVGFTSVNVLHSKAMWKQIGGYDEGIIFYEDGEYNARLLGTFCGVRCPKPLVEYRMHASQRTKTYEKQSAYYAKLVTEKVRTYEMGCPGCRGRRTHGLNNSVVVQSNQSMNVQQNPTDMPLMDDKGYVLVQYNGGNGRGTHWYNGLSTGNAYRVKYGVYLYVDKNDSREPTDTHSHSFFIRVVREEPVMAKKAPAVKAPVAEVMTAMAPARRTAVTTSVARTPVWEAPNLSKMRLVDIQNLELTPKQAAELLEQEETGRTRAKVIEWLTLKAEEK